MKKMKLLSLLITIIMVTSVFAQKKPNIFVIWEDDIGISNISQNNRGMMGYMTGQMLLEIKKTNQL